jgi:DNA-binding XRE family transcriptional regulator
MRGTSISIEKLFFSGTATIVMWTDGTKTVVQPIEGEKFDPEIGIAMAIARKLFGSRHQFDKFVDEKVRDLATRNAKAFTDKELATLIVEKSATIDAAKKKHAADKVAYNAAKAAGEKKLPVLSGLKSDRRYRYAKIMIDAFTAEQKDRKREKAARAASTRKDTKKPTTAKKSSTRKKSTK